MTDRDWQSEKTFPETNLHMLESQLLTDVTFLVGEQREAIQSHKFILVSRSCVFETMFCGPMSESDRVEIADTDVDTFKAFLRFVYTNSISLDAGIVLSTLYVAKKYSVVALEKKCLEFCESAIAPSNAFIFLQQAFMYDEENLKSRALDIIKSNTMDCLAADGFCDLSQQCLNLILETDDMNVDEIEVFKAVVAWASAECRRQGKEVTPVAKRSVLGKLLFMIRFPQIPQSELAKHVYPERLLTDEELVLMFVRYTEPETPLGDFTDKHRKPKSYHLSRSPLQRKSMQEGNRLDAVLLSCSRPTTLTSIYVYGGDLNSSYKITFEVLVESGENVLAKTSGEIQRDQNQQECKIQLPSPVHLTAEEKILLSVRCKGPERWTCKMNKKKEVFDEVSGVMWKFEHSSSGNSSHSLEYGHITGFAYH